MTKPNELYPELLGIQATNFATGTNSASRAYMYGSHKSSDLVIEGSTEKRIQTGVECRMGDYVFNKKAPCDMRVLRMIDRYPTRIDVDAIPENPEMVVIYEEVTNDPNVNRLPQIGCMVIPRHASYHQYFGFEYKLTPEFKRLVPGLYKSAGTDYIEKDTIFANSPSIGENGGYKFGIELNVAGMSHPAVAEDGILISEDVLPRLRFKVYDKRVVEFGNHAFPLNLYGHAGHYQPFPEIGQMVRDDGILVMLRNYESDLGPVLTSITDCMTPDFIFDDAIYVRGPGSIIQGEKDGHPVEIKSGKIVDIKIYHDDNEPSKTPEGVMSAMNKYTRALKRFYRELLEAYESIREERRRKYGEAEVILKPELHRLLVEAMAVLGRNHSRKDSKNGKELKKDSKLNLVYRKVPLDDYRVELTIEYTVQPTIGYKLTCSQGGKGVICYIEKPENMPVDEAGNRADIVVGAETTFSRMNLGRLYEMFFGACERDVTKTVRSILGIPKQPYATALPAVRALAQQAPDQFDNAYRYRMGFYQIISPLQYQHYAGLGLDDKIEHLARLVENGGSIFYPTNHEYEISDVARRLQQEYKPTYGPVTYVGYSGHRVTTEYPVRIAPVYMMLLDKITDVLSSVASGTLQHFGILSPITRAQKYTFPHRNSPVRTIGESEGRIFAGYCGRAAIAEMLDRSTSPTTHRYVVWTILTAAQPTNIPMAIDRHQVPLGGSKPLGLVRHVAMCGGWRMKYTPPTLPVTSPYFTTFKPKG